MKTLEAVAKDEAKTHEKGLKDDENAKAEEDECSYSYSEEEDRKDDKKEADNKSIS